MRTRLVVPVAAVVAPAALAVSAHSQEPIRAGAVIDVAAPVNKFDAVTKLGRDG